ncbi:MAG: DUF4345 domain-containing protein [Leptolyngbyaceae bacterium]|nr:DUF4345 domain-containing protein [Leptolyngbyaceae bacterium]
MKQSKRLTVVLCLSGLVAIAIGAMILISPADFYATNHITIGDDVNLLSEIRASAGALFASGVLILIGAFVSQLTFTSTLLATVLFLSYGVSRGIGILIDGVPVSSLIQAGVIEIVIGLVCLGCLWPNHTDGPSVRQEDIG